MTNETMTIPARPWRRAVFAGLLLAFGEAAGDSAPPAADPALEEELLFQDIPSVYSASKYAQRITEAPSSVSIVTADEIRNYGYRTLADILRSLRGFYTGYDRNYNYLGVRGFGRPGDYNTRVLVLVNGHHVNDSVYGGMLLGNGFVLDVDLIERVEVVRGPSSSLYGSSAFFGVVNVITKRGRGLAGTEVAVDAGSDDAYKARASYGGKFGKGAEALFSASYLDSAGADRLYYPEYDTPADNNGIAEGADGERGANLFGRLEFGDLTAEAAFVKRKKSVPTGAFGTVFNDPGTWTVDAQSYLDLNYQTVLAGGAEASARLYYDRYWYYGDYVYDYGPPPDIVVNKDSGDGEWWGTEVRLSKHLQARHRVTAGAEYRDNLRQDQKNYDVYGLYLDDRRDSSTWGIFLQDEFEIRSDLILNAGVRHDHFDVFGGTTNPRIGLIYGARESTTVKLLYGTAFRAPSAYELYYQDGSTHNAPSAGLDPETIASLDLVLEHDFGDAVRGVATVFRNEIEDLISLQPDPADPFNFTTFGNRDRVRSTGAELEIEGRWRGGWSGRASYAYQRTEDRGTGVRLTNSPPHMVKLNLTAPALRGVVPGVEAQYIGVRKTLAGAQADAFVLTNLTAVGRDWLPGLEVSLAVYNLFDERYADPGSEEHLQDAIEQDGRSFRLRARYAF